MPTISTQTTEIYKIVESDEIEFMSTMRTITSKYTGETICIFYTGKTICIFFKSSLCSGSNDKNTMTSYNSLNDQFMDIYIEQLKSAGDY
jgi:hypothetical protein